MREIERRKKNTGGGGLTAIASGSAKRGKPVTNSSFLR